MKKLNFLILTILVLSYACSNHQKSKLHDGDTKESGHACCKALKPVLKKVGETKSDLKVPESVCYDSIRNIAYVSNIDGESVAKDGKGFISKIDLQGNIVELNWISGLDAPKGMGIYNDLLYVTDVDNVVVIDIKAGKITKKIPVKGTQFLNDIAIDKAGVVYVTESKQNVVYALKGDVAELFIKGEGWGFANGLTIDGDNLLIGVGNQLKAYSFAKKELTTLVDSSGGIDGLNKVKENTYLISDWTGNISIIEPAQARIILQKAVDKINAADMEFVASKNLVLVPTFFDNRVVIYQLDWE